MSEITFRPNWASAPGETIQAIIQDRDISPAWLQESLAMRESELNNLIAGRLPISEELAKRLAEALGSTSRFWLKRDKQYHSSLRELELAVPELASWVRSFPLNEMVNSGWLRRPASKKTAASELLEYFGVSNLAEWREEYQARLRRTQFRTSQSFENTTASTTAWIRRGELVAEQMNCGVFNKYNFRQSLQELKSLTLEKNPRRFISALQLACSRHGVAVVVARCASGCTASGATYLLETGTALLLLSARFLSDDQFWFSFFHEAGHLVLHTNESCVEEKGAEPNELEIEANRFAQEIILFPLGEQELLNLEPSKFSIARFARRCRVAPGLIVGQLQHRKKLSHSSYRAMKVHYAARDLSLESQLE